MVDPRTLHGSPTVVARVGGALLIAVLMLFWSLKRFGPNRVARAQASAFAGAVVVGASLDEVRALERGADVDELSFSETTVTGDAGCRATLVVAKTPYEWGARNAWAIAVVEDGRATGVVFRSAEGLHARARGTPPDRDEAISACVRAALAPLR